MEWETIRGILLNRKQDDAVIPVHLDDAEVRGWSAVNFGVRLRDRTPQQIADVILQALELRLSDGGEASDQLASPIARHPSRVATPQPTPTQKSPTGALAIWIEKRDYLQQQEAITSDAAQKFALMKQIEEAKAKIRELEG